MRFAERTKSVTYHALAKGHSAIKLAAFMRIPRVENGPNDKAVDLAQAIQSNMPSTTLISRFKHVIHTDRRRESAPYRCRIIFRLWP